MAFVAENQSFVQQQSKFIVSENDFQFYDTRAQIYISCGSRTMEFYSHLSSSIASYVICQTREFV